MFGLAIASFTAAALGWRIYLVRKVRYDALKQCEQKYGYLNDKPEHMTCKLQTLQLPPLSSLIVRTDDVAAEIMKVSHYWDYPWSMALALSLALFNTYAIPSISSVSNKCLVGCRVGHG